MKIATYGNYCEEHALPGAMFTGKRRINSPRHGSVYLSGHYQENKQPQKDFNLKWIRNIIPKCIGDRCFGDNTSDFKAKRSKRKTTSAKKSVKKPVKKALQKTPKKPVKKTPKKASKKSHARRV